VLAEVSRPAPVHGLLVLQPLDEHVERGLIDRAQGTERLVRRGQESGDFRVDLPADWVLTTITWLVVGAADGLRLGVVAPPGSSTW
jgi:TetR/AcrR family transcriptional repressor of mexCD-oprJ operon